MSRPKIHIIHVSNMNNKGTQALFRSDVYTIHETIKNKVFVSVSTTDIEGVNRLALSLDKVLPPVVDVPYEKADQLANKYGFARESLRYKGFVLEMFFRMFVQILLSVFSVAFVKMGLKAFYREEVLNCLKKCDLVISHSDENFKETASLLPLNPYWVITMWSMLFSRTWDILIAKSLGKPVVMFPNSLGPFRTWIGRFLSRLSIGNCDYILIRDSISYGIVEKLGIGSPKILTFDTALLFKSNMHIEIFNGLSRPLVGVSPGIYSHTLSLREIENYIVAHAKALDTAIEEHGFSIVFLPHYISGFHQDDLEVSKRILDKMKHRKRARIINTWHAEDFKSYLDQMDMIISSKMHPAVFGATGYVPTLCIAYDHKQTSFFERLDLDYCTINIRMVSYERLSSKIDQVWSRREQIRETLKRQIPSWQKDVKEAMRRTIASCVETG